MFSSQQNQVYSYYWIICNAKTVTVVDNSLGCKCFLFPPHSLARFLPFLNVQRQQYTGWIEL